MAIVMRNIFTDQNKADYSLPKAIEFQYQKPKTC